MDITNSQNNTFDSIKKINVIGEEYWEARELMLLLGYKKWENFEKVIDKAKQSLKSLQIDPINHFPEARKTIKMPKGAEKIIANYNLTRYACYLIAQNGNSKKIEIAQAQSYFAQQSRRQEINEQIGNDLKRLENRVKLTTSRKKLREEVYTRGIDTGPKFAKLEDSINIGLYKKRTVDVKRLKQIDKNQPLDDHVSAIELAAKNLSVEMTSYNVVNKDLKGEIPINKEGFDNSNNIRNTLYLRGIIPESLPKEEDIKKLQKKYNRDQQIANKSTSEKPTKIDANGFDDAVKKIL